MSDEPKQRFRSAIKNQTLDYLTNELKKVERKLIENKSSLLRIQKEQNTLKKERAGLSQMVEEYKK